MCSGVEPSQHSRASENGAVPCLRLQCLRLKCACPFSLRNGIRPEARVVCSCLQAARDSVIPAPTVRSSASERCKTIAEEDGEILSCSPWPKTENLQFSVDSSVEPAGTLAGKCAGNMRCCKTGTCNEHSGVSRDDCSLEVMCRCVTIPDAVNPCLQGKPTSCPMRHRSLQECSSLCCARDLSFMLAAVSVLRLSFVS